MAYKSLFSLFVFLVVASCQSVKYADRGGSSGSGFLSAKKSTSKICQEYPAQSFHSVQTEKTDSDYHELVSTYTGKSNQNTASKKSDLKLLQQIKKNASIQKIFSVGQQVDIGKSSPKTKKDNPEEGSLRWFVYMILCFLVPPLAYFLIKRQTDTLFWICFFCFLLTITFFGGFRYGLLGLLSVVIALLTLFQIDI